MKLHELQPAPGATRERKRVGRGTGSGLGKTSGYGHKGQKARSGSKKHGFEGGQLPLTRRLPKRGFVNINKKEFELVKVEALNIFEDGAIIGVAELIDAGLVRTIKDGVKILGNGEITKKLTVKAAKFTKSAQEKIEAVGGSVEVI